MSALKNQRLIKAMLCEPTDKTPVWVMRQAGRYLPEYRAIRQQAGDFLTLCKTPELACEVTLQPLRRFDLDAAILFSDILTIPDAMNLGLYFSEGEGPRFKTPVRTAEAIRKLGVPDPESDLAYVMDAIRVIKRELDNRVPLIGFAGSPWTIATYMVEGGASKNHSTIKAMLYREPQLMHQLLNTLAKAITEYLNAQVAAGVDALMIFDTWGGILTPEAYQQFSLHYMADIIAGLTREVEGRRIPVTLFTKGGQQNLEHIAKSGCDCIGLDWTIDINEARQRVDANIALQGNLDPSILYAHPDRIVSEVKTILQGYGQTPGHVFNLGHGIYPDVPPEHVKVLVDAVHAYS